MEKPSLDEVYRIQQAYIEELTRYATSILLLISVLTHDRSIWDTYKDEFAKTRVRELSIIE